MTDDGFSCSVFLRAPLGGCSGQALDDVLEVAGLHGLFHGPLGLLDALVRHLERDGGRADFVGVLLDQGPGAIAHEADGDALKSLLGFRSPAIRGGYRHLATSVAAVRTVSAGLVQLGFCRRSLTGSLV